MSGSTWVIMRTEPFSDVVAAVDADDGGEEARRLAGELGEPHMAVEVPRVLPGQWRVVHTWVCQAEVDGGVRVGDPFRAVGASQVVRPDDVPVESETVVVQDEASQLESSVRGRPVILLVGYASSAERAVAVVRGRAEELAPGS